MTIDEMTVVARAGGRAPADRKDLVSLDEAEEILAQSGDFPQREKLRQSAARLRQIDVQGLTKQYWDTVYGIYSVIPHPVDPRAQGATSALFSRATRKVTLISAAAMF
jgi:hypothetical protein